jgi:hypothetical protein
MQRLKDTPITLMKKLTTNVCTTGQKNYALALRHAAKFSNPLGESASTMLESLSKYHVSDFSDEKIIL